jgi:hypothetical protein
MSDYIEDFVDPESLGVAPPISTHDYVMVIGPLSQEIAISVDDLEELFVYFQEARQENDYRRGYPKYSASMKRMDETFERVKALLEKR